MKNEKYRMQKGELSRTREQDSRAILHFAFPIKAMLVSLLIAGAAWGDGVTVLSGEAHGRLGRDRSPYLVKGVLVVPYGKRLVIEPGVVLKFYAFEVGAQDLGRLVVEGGIQAVGTPEAPIIFTTSQDRSVAPEADLRNREGRPMPWGWVEILGRPLRYVAGYRTPYDHYWLRPEEQQALQARVSGEAPPGEAPAADTTSVLAHCIVRYGGFHWALNLYTTAAVRSCLFTENMTVPVGIFGGRPRVEGCLVTHNHSHGIQLHVGSSADIVGNRIVENAGFGIDVFYSPGVVIRHNVVQGHSIGILNASGTTVIERNEISGNRYGIQNLKSFFDIHAAHNYWGDASGPNAETDGGAGKGDRVTGRVVYRPFLTAPPDSLPTEWHGVAPRFQNQSVW